MRIIKEDAEHRIVENPNYSKGEGDVFLERGNPNTGEWRCCGTAYGREDWHASIFQPYDPEADTDCKDVYYGKSRREAIESLWKHRYNAVL